MKSRYKICYGNKIENYVHAVNEAAKAFVRSNEFPYYFLRDHFTGKIIEVFSSTENK